MIIEWKKDCIKVIPILTGGALNGQINLLPGENLVDDQTWSEARKHVLDDIQRSLIIEKHAEIKEKMVDVKKINPKTKEEKIEKVKEFDIKSKSLKDLEIIEAEKIVKNTYNLKTLNGWKKEETRDSVRAIILNQIDDIEKYGEKKKKKMNQSEAVNEE